ncbi:magnesium/cobalt transporter CorA [Desulfohalobium retbaense]|uniref:Magnesium transport protein CorA n=1 Tax=Desulfohalobium retbaense (strain ATCC 49708 / DSM 5692 / JCM 16813 / HR100) TaxID=485915 RepID=C8X206_DESRD|nr:magnesium/cobalt transporter CorA [Desulfohalobium retbaense]ACV68329.1 magnesium and cobalt transport protein CorA [Desulfohalobium retbaense DSM 5692]
MPQTVHKKNGLPPGSLVYVGEPPTSKTVIRHIRYSQNEMTIEEVATPEQCVLDPGWNHWIQCIGVHDPAVLEGFRKHFGIHPLALEDVMNTEHRPKLEHFPDSLFLVCKWLGFNEDRSLSDNHISLIMQNDVLLTFQEGGRDIFTPLHARLAKPSSRLRQRDLDYLVYSLLDTVVDSYFSLMETLGQHIEDIEEQILNSPDRDIRLTLQNMRASTLRIRRIVWPLREILSDLLRDPRETFQDEVHSYLRDVYDHVIQSIDMLDIHRDMLASLFDLHLSGVSLRMNQIMQMLTLVATIFIPLSFVAGVYGMNFEYMPELGWEWGYFAVLLSMGGLAGVMLWVFKRRGWW